jgi:hypothetical protein
MVDEFTLHRIVSVGGWLHGIDERDIGTELPLRSVDFENEVCKKLILIGLFD